MPVCVSCGGEVPEGAAFCPNCGAPTVSSTRAAKHYVNRGYGISFDYPADWEILDENAKAGVWDIPVVVAGHEGRLAREGVSINIQRVRRPVEWRGVPGEYLRVIDLESWVKKSDQELAAAFSGYKRLVAEAVSINGKDGFRLVYTYDGDRARKLEQIVTLFYEDKIYQIICETSEQEFKRFKAKFDMIINSFTIQNRRKFQRKS